MCLLYYIIHISHFLTKWKAQIFRNLSSDKSCLLSLNLYTFIKGQCACPGLCGLGFESSLYQSDAAHQDFHPPFNK